MSGTNGKSNGRHTQKQRKYNEKSLANLKPFPKGVSGNPGGRIKGSVNLMAKIKQQMLEAAGDGKERADVIAEQYVKDCERGSLPHIKEFLDRDEGKVPDKLDANLTIETPKQQAIGTVMSDPQAFEHLRQARERLQHVKASSNGNGVHYDDDVSTN